MSQRQWRVLLGAFVLAGSAIVVAQDAKPTTPRTRLPADYRQLSDLSDDQKTKILDVREKADQDIEAIRQKEATDMLAVLTPAQQAQLKEIDATQKQSVRERRDEEELQQRISADQQKLDDLKNNPTTNPTPQN